MSDNTQTESERPPPPPPPPPPRPTSNHNVLSSAGNSGHAAGAGEGGVSEEQLKIAKGSNLETLAKFEAQRCTYFGGLLHSNELYWLSFVDLIKRNQLSTEKAILYVTTKLLATRAYAQSLYGIRDLVMDNKPGTTAALREKERTAAVKDSLAKGRSGLMLSSAVVLNENETGSALEFMFEAEEKQAMILQTMCDELDIDVVGKVLKAMSDDLKAQFGGMLATGNACLKVLGQYEESTVKAYTTLRNAIIASLSIPTAGSVQSLAANGELPTQAGDVWIADMEYRVTVSQQLMVSDGVSAQLGDLFRRMKDIEVNRRRAIRNALTGVLQAQDLVWRQLPVVKDPVLQMLERITVDRRALDTEIREAMRTGAATRLKDKDPPSTATGINKGGASMHIGRKSSMSGGTAGGPRRGSADNDVAMSAVPGFEGDSTASDTDPIPGRRLIQQLESPLSSPFIRKVGLVERKKDTLITRWSACLAILTYDGWLHIFDLPATSKQSKLLGRLAGGGATTPVTQAAAASEAFCDCMPIVKVEDVVATVAKAKASSASPAILPPLPPSFSYDLHISEAVAHEPKGSDAGGPGAGGWFEVLEVQKNSGFRKVFKDFDKRRFALRAPERDSVARWVALINDIGRSGMEQAKKDGMA